MNKTLEFKIAGGNKVNLKTKEILNLILPDIRQMVGTKILTQKGFTASFKAWVERF